MLEAHRDEEMKLTFDFEPAMYQLFVVRHLTAHPTCRRSSDPTPYRLQPTATDVLRSNTSVKC